MVVKKIGMKNKKKNIKTIVVKKIGTKNKIRNNWKFCQKMNQKIKMVNKLMQRKKKKRKSKSFKKTQSERI